MSTVRQDRPEISTKKPRLVLADDYEDLLVEIGSLLAHDFDVVALARDGVELLSAVRKLKPDVVVTDITMPRLSGIEASREILREQHCDAIVLLTVHNEKELVGKALRAGILGYVLKVNAGVELIPAIFAVLGGESFVSESVNL